MFDWDYTFKYMIMGAEMIVLGVWKKYVHMYYDKIMEGVMVFYTSVVLFFIEQTWLLCVDAG